METSCVVIELLPNSAEKVRQWGEYLLVNHEEALRSLRREGVTIESAFVVNIEGKEYLVGYMRTVSMDDAHGAPKDPTPSLDAYHLAFKKACWGKRYKCMPVVDLSRISDEAGYA